MRIDSDCFERGGRGPEEKTHAVARTMTPALRVALFPQRLPGGPIDFDVELGGARTPGRILPEDPEYAAAVEAIETHVWRRTMAGPVPPSLELPVERVRAMTARRLPSGSCSAQPQPRRGQ